MDTRFLKTFVTVVDEGSMAAAARSLGLTPAAVAQQMRALERELGTPLLARAGRTVHITEAGSRVLQRARDLIQDVRDMRSIAVESELSGELRLGACPTALSGIVPDLLARMVQQIPGLKVFIRPGYSAELYHHVESGRLDAAVVLRAPFEPPKSCDWRLLRTEPLIVLAPQALADRDPLELLATQPFIRYDRSKWGGRLADEYLASMQIKPRERFELNALNAIAVMVDRGLGVSLVPDWAHPWPEGLRVAAMALPDPVPHRSIGLVWSRRSVRLRFVETLLALAPEVAEPE